MRLPAIPSLSATAVTDQTRSATIRIPGNESASHDGTNVPSVGEPVLVAPCASASRYVPPSLPGSAAREEDMTHECVPDLANLRVAFPPIVCTPPRFLTQKR